MLGKYDWRLVSVNMQLIALNDAIRVTCHMARMLLLLFATVDFSTYVISARTCEYTTFYNYSQHYSHFIVTHNSSCPVAGAASFSLDPCRRLIAAHFIVQLGQTTGRVWQLIASTTVHCCCFDKHHIQRCTYFSSNSIIQISNQQQ